METCSSWEKTAWHRFLGHPPTPYLQPFRTVKGELLLSKGKRKSRKPGLIIVLFWRWCLSSWSISVRSYPNWLCLWRLSLGHAKFPTLAFFLSPPSGFDQVLVTICSWKTHIFLHGSCSLAYTSRCLCSRICSSLLPQAKRESLSVTQVPTHSGCFPGNSEISSLWNTQVPPTDGVRRSSVLAHPAPQLGSKPLLVSSCQISCSLSFKQSNVQHPKVGYQSNLPSEKSNDE